MREIYACPRQSFFLVLKAQRSFLVLLFLLLFGPLCVAAPGQQLGWAKGAGGTSFDSSRSITVDVAGNSYVTGRFGNAAATFGLGEANETILSPSGIVTVFLAKYDRLGALVWAKRAGGNSQDEGHGIAVDGAGNVYVTGQFGRTATFGPGEANETVLNIVGFAPGDIFVAKYDSFGALVWAKQAGGSGGVDVGNGIAVDGAGYSYVTGHFRETATFGPGEANEVTLSDPGGSLDAFLAKYDPSGDLVWAKLVGGSEGESSRGIAVDGAGASYVTGEFAGTATFGPGEANETILIGSEEATSNLFLAKYDSDGFLVWAKRAEGFSTSVAVDETGASYVTGQFSGAATFGPDESNETVLSSFGQSDVFVAKYDSAGALVWAKQAGGSTIDSGIGIAVDGAGVSYVTGDFAGSATFGPGESNEIILDSLGGADCFLAKYDIAGNLIEVQQAGGTSGDAGVGVAVDGAGHSYVTGSFRDMATLGTGESNETTLSSSGNADIFVAKYGADCPYDPNPEFGDACVAPGASIGNNVQLGEGVVIASGATLKNGASVGDGTVIEAGATVGIIAVVGSNTVIGQNAWVKQGAQVGDDTQVGDGAVVGISSRVGNGVTLAAGAHVKQGAILGDSIEVGSESIIGEYVVVGAGSSIGADTHVKQGSILGTETQLGFNAIIGLSVELGDRVSIGDRTQIRQNTTVGSDTHIGTDGDIRKSVEIGERVIIGNFVTVLGNATIPDDAVIPNGLTVP